MNINRLKEPLDPKKWCAPPKTIGCTTMGHVKMLLLGGESEFIDDSQLRLTVINEMNTPPSFKHMLNIIQEKI